MPIGLQREWQSNLDATEMGLRAGLQDLQRHKIAYDSVLARSDYASVQYYVIRLGNTPDFLCSSIMLPEYDFNGNQIQNLGNLDAELTAITYSMICTDNGGAIVFTWLGENKACRQLITSLNALSNDELSHAIVRYTFEYFENVCISPHWWNSLDDRAKNALMRRFTLALQLDNARATDCLEDDGLRAVTWHIMARDTNISF